MRSKQYYVYIMANKTNRVVCTGVTGDLKRRVYEHREKLIEGFKLVCFEVLDDAENAILGEKQIKAVSRQKKLDLVGCANAEWRDLYEAL